MSPTRAKKAKPAPLDWLTISQFGLSALGMTLACMLALFALLGLMLQQAQDGQTAFPTLGELVPIVGIFFIGLLLFPSTLYALRRLLGCPSSPAKIPGRLFGLAILLLPLLLIVGSAAVQADRPWLALLAHLLAALLTVGWLLWLALRGLQLGSSQRSWGALGSGLAASPMLAFILEGIGLLLLIAVLGFYIEVNPALTGIGASLESTADPQVLIEALTPLFNDPLVLLTAFVSLGFVVPVIEELLKPLGVYLLMRRELSEAQGFALGALCGAGFALVENLGLNTQPDTLFLVTGARFGASAMHIFTAALSGYAVVRAKKQKSLWPFLGILALNIFIHGLWNAMVLLLAAGALNASGSSSLIPVDFALLALSILLILSFAFVIFLQVMNRRLLNTTSKLRSV